MRNRDRLSLITVLLVPLSASLKDSPRLRWLPRGRDALSCTQNRLVLVDNTYLFNTLQLSLPSCVLGTWDYLSFPNRMSSRKQLSQSSLGCGEVAMRSCTQIRLVVVVITYLSNTLHLSNSLLPHHDESCTCYHSHTFPSGINILLINLPIFVFSSR